MKKKNLLFVAAAMVMAGCASDDMIGDNNATQSDNQVIGFNMSTPAMTRADDLTGSNAATKLGNEFIVWGEKNESTKSNSNYAIDATQNNADLVFKNYVVLYGANTANTTTSNTKDWEYVNVSHANYDAHVNPTVGSGVTQTIKYWDAKASDYTFTAISADDGKINSGDIQIKKITSSESTTPSVYDKGYEITVTSEDAASSIYVSDRVNITQAVLSTNNEENKYGGHVKFTFRNFLTKIRFGFYETIPGYDVQIKDVTYGSVKNGTSDFGVNSGFYAMPDGSTTSTKFIVTYENGDNGTTANKAQIKADDTATKATSMKFGTNLFTASNRNLAETSALPTYDKTGTGSETYTSILPNPDNQTNMTFKISYKLISKDTKEEIEVNDQDVTVPYQYCKWKSNYAYTYIFKISDQSAKLYPITFDACVVQDETGKQETITEVGEPSITTFATRTTGGITNYVTGENEYKANDVIYATILESGKVVTLSNSNVELYTVTSSDETNFKITESSVANALAHSSVTGKITYQKVTLDDTNSFVAKVPAEDGSDITLDNSGKALTWTPTAAATYAIQYKGTDNKLYYKIVKVVAQ